MAGASAEALLRSRSSATELIGDDAPPAGGAANGLGDWSSSFLVATSEGEGGSRCVITDGEADAARNCSSRLGPVAEEGDDFTKEECAGFPG